ncbi:hypothetical protein [Caballeronia sp. LZ001]|jgi:hypothetical protein|uniref:hypothetical protein n=1 Tax=Caballeronia sp. LZ001 TaxID=3038553 RepID=UPI00286430BF|nr:hypothetical protein [Caballeronia sp. LZ001]MDR5802132.1 hypothetical protein [Caballeronia sp. LZ001]
MATKYKEMVKAATLTGTAATYYTAPVLTYAAIHAVSANNPTAGAVTVNVYKVPTSAAADGTTRLASKIVPAGRPMQFPELVNHKLEPGTQIYADGNGCSLNISGIEYVPE